MAADDLKTQLLWLCSDGDLGEDNFSMKGKPLRDFLKKHGDDIDLDVTDKRGLSPVTLACRCLHKECLELLLEHGAKPDAKDANGNTPLCVACNGEDIFCVEILLKHGADPNLPNSSGNTPLHVACKFKLDEIIQVLLEHGANPNARNEHGQTPLHYLLAIRLWKDNVIEYDESEKDDLIFSFRHLLKAGADPTIKERLGFSVKQILARYLQRKEMLYPGACVALEECQKMVNEHLSKSRKRSRSEVSEDVEPIAKRTRLAQRAH